jgi:tetratricopeptide (TPR) repeat protein
MALSEIEKLERRYAENPQGLTFAPLAEVHRKNGDVARALDLLRSGLELHPDYIPAGIVLGRCHLDLGDLPAAETAFGHVLELDGENVIALKALADISERQHRFDQAERWLGTLLSVDRSNDDARAQLERIQTARHDTGAAPPPPAAAAETSAVVAEGDVTDAEPPPAMSEEPAVVPPPPPPPPMEEPSPMAGWVSPSDHEAAPLPLADLEPSYAGGGAVEPPPAGLELDEPQAIEESIEPIAGLVGRDVDQVEPPGGDFDVELSEDIVLRSSGGHEFQMPDAAAELSDRMPVPPASPFGAERAPMFAGLEDSPPAPAPVTEMPEPTPTAGADDDSSLVRWPSMASRTEAREVEEAAAEPAAAEPVAAAPEPIVVSDPKPDMVVTETMAEVLRDQGHSEEALRIYRELQMRNAGDPRFLRRIAELEGERGTASGPTPRRKYVVSETGGRSVREFFQAMLATRPPAAPAAPPVARPALVVPPSESAGAPTRPAADALSLSSVFGEETTPLPPAVPAAGATPAAGVSFDEFYGAPGGSSSPKPRAPDPKSDDLDQFHAWLQNLKR